MSQISPLSPKELLCALFLLAQEVPRLTEADLIRATGADLWAIRAGLETLRREGLVAEAGPRLTFLGLMAATQLVPSAAWTRDDASIRAAS